MIYRFDVTMNWNGRGNRDSFKNTFYRQSAVELTSPDIPSAAQFLILYMRPLMLEIVHFMSVRCVRHMNDDHSLADGEYRTFGQSGTGSRAIVGAPMPRESVAFVLRQTATRGAGYLLHRGMLLESDVIRQGDGSELLAPATSTNIAGCLRQMWATCRIHRCPVIG